MHSTVCIMEVTMLKASSVCTVVKHIEWHSMSIGAEYWGFIHVIPEWVHPVWAFEVLVSELAPPEALSIFIKEINISGVSRPAIPIEVLEVRSANEDICHVTFRLSGILKLETLSIHFILFACLNVGINDHSDSSVACFNFRVHLVNLTGRKVLRVKNEILISLWIAILVRPLDVHPKYIDREFEISEVTITFDNHLSTYISPLTKVET